MATTTTVLLSSGLIFCLFSTTSIAVDTLTANQTIRDDGNSNIESATGAFEMGFFSPGSSKNRYFGIWYKNISTGTVVWVANRESPLTDTSGVLRVGLNGVLVLKDGANSVIWSSNSSGSARDPVAQLLDTGNLVIRNGNDSYPKNFLWQSFDHPRDHILPTMKVGWDLVKGLNRQLVSWKSADDPSPGNFTSGFNLSGYPQLLQWKGSVLQFRFGPWNGIEFSGRSSATPGPSFMHSFVLNEKETYYHFDLSTTSRRMVLNQNGTMQLLIWNNRTQIWDVNLTAQRDDCDHYTLCGAYSSCYMIKSRSGNVTCGCLKGFRPKNSTKWELAEWSDGCVRRTPLNCKTGDRFVKYPGLKLPDTRHSWFDQRINLEECKRVCLRNCSCTAYSNIDVREGGLGCLLWFSDLIDIRDCSNEHIRGHGQDLYIRMAASESDVNKSSREKRGGKIRTIEIAALVVLVILPGLFAGHVYKKRKQRRRGILTLNTEGDARNENRREELELPLFDFEIIANTTNNFSQNNKLGEGGFGPVYKGILDDGQEIAVKRLSKTSNQGLDEFKNEVSCIAKLQHRNLVKLLGCCIQEGEMLLIYEYMPNKSLDSFVFDKELGMSLDWPTRYNIINGIARGLLYLHHDSRLRIIHRDLKAGNILLDYEMNPKISDFGMARSFGATEIQINTRRVVGTYGYMSPEYAIDGLFSVKSDVYSFGVVVLEIVTGEKISNFYNPDQNLNLLGHAWKLFKEGKFLELMDQTIVMESSNQSELFRAIQIGLLCVQPYPRNRPCMLSVVSMLTGDAELPQPEQPGFFTERSQLNYSGQHDPSVCNELTVTFFAPR